MFGRWWLVAAVGLAAVLPTPVTPASVAASSTSIQWRSCGERLQCARVRVPLDWDRPHGRTISLKLIRHLASKPEQRIGSMFINPGGPGDSGVGLVKGAGDDLDGWGAGRFDVVSWDPRGTNASTPVRCFGSERSAARFWRRIDSHHEGAIHVVQSQVHGARSPLWQCQRLAVTSHLDRGHGP